jgi:hypothetical protein
MHPGIRDGCNSQLSASLPTGFTFRNAGFLLVFISDNPNLSTLPNLPTQFAPTSQWNVDDAFNLAQFRITGAYGFAYVDVFNAAGSRVDSSFMSFTVASVTAVPEPSASTLGLLLFGGIPHKTKAEYQVTFTFESPSCGAPVPNIGVQFTCQVIEQKLPPLGQIGGLVGNRGHAIHQASQATELDVSC